jgi:hypothetical protein
MTLPSNATLEERENLAYLEGRLEEAKLLRQLIEARKRIYESSLF